MSSSLVQPVRPKVLVVDDEPENVEVVVRALRREYEIVTAYDGSEGIRRLEEFAPDLVITDQRMPGATGVEVLEAARRKSPEAQRIMLTGYTDSIDLVAAINRGEVWRYLVKPIEVEELKLAASQALERVRLLRENRLLVEQLQARNADLTRTTAELADAKALLDTRVRERTSELAKANEELAVALRQVSELARTDSLTGLSNRRFFDEVFAREIARSLRFLRPLGLVILDLDHFKRVNDEHGHPAGDKLLKDFGQILAGTCRTTDVPARIGGEEFALLLPETSLDGAEVIAERIRKQLEFRSLGATVSAGIAACPENGSVPAALLEAADKALYEAKNSGRNRTVKAIANIVTPR